MFKKLLLNESGNISWMKLGGLIVTISGVIVSGIVPGLPIALVTGAKIAIAVGGSIGIAGARDAIGQKNINGQITTTTQVLTEDKK
jgi:hypothetical protein